MNANWPERFRREVNGEKEEMSTFERNFDIAKIGEDRLMRDLLSLWKPAGADAGENGLRIAVRDGYLNFYRMGQSIAKIAPSHGVLKAKVHGKYVDPSQKGQSYSTVGPQNYNAIAQLEQWIKNSHIHSGGEKIFVDTLVAKNQNIIDLEMALPSSVNAPRMDLVALEKISDTWTIVFWEAKLVKNPGICCKGEGKPLIFTQLKQYDDWLKSNHDDVIRAYRSTCEILNALHSSALRHNPKIEALGEGIVAVARGAQLALEREPKARLVIDNAIAKNSFRQNGHLEKLIRGGIVVQVVENNGPFVLESHR